MRTSDARSTKKAAAWVVAFAVFWSGMSGLFGMAHAQEPSSALRSPILVIDFEALFRNSEFGRAIQSDLDEKSRALAAENARIDRELAAEEKALTAQRGTLAAEDFRNLADDFDARVQQLRAEQDEKAQAINRLQAEEQLQFRQAAVPILGQLMLETGALIVMEKRSVLVFNDGIDVTEITAERLDAVQANALDSPTPGTVEGTIPDVSQDTGPEATPNPQPEPTPEPTPEYTPETGIESGSDAPDGIAAEPADQD